MDDVLKRKLFNQQPTPTRGTGITASFLPVQNYQDGGDVEPMIDFPEGSEPTKDWAIPRGLYDLIGRPVGRTIKNIGPMLGDLMDPFGAYKPFKGMVKPKEVTDALEKEIKLQQEGSFQSKYRYGDLINDASAISNFQDNVPTEIIQRKKAEKNRKDQIRGLNYLKEGIQRMGTSPFAAYVPGTARNKQRILQKIIKDPSTPENIKQQSIAQLNKINQQIANTNLRKQNLPTSDVALTDDVTTVDTQPQMEKSVIPVMDDPDFQTQLNNLGDVTVQAESGGYGNYQEAAEDYDPDRGYGTRGAIIGDADERGPFQFKPTSASQNYGYGAFSGKTLRQVLDLPEDASQFEVDKAMQDPETGKAVHDEITKANLLALAKLDTKETDPTKILQEGINSPKTRALSQLAYNRGVGGTRNWVDAGMNIDALTEEQKTRMKRAAGVTTDDDLKLALSGELPVEDKKEIKVASTEDIKDYGTKDNPPNVPANRKSVPKEDTEKTLIGIDGEKVVIKKDGTVSVPDVDQLKKEDVSEEKAKGLNVKHQKVIGFLNKQGINMSMEDLIEYGEVVGTLGGIEKLKGARRRDFALMLAAGLLSNRSRDSGITGFLDVVGQSIAPAVEAGSMYNDAIFGLEQGGVRLLEEMTKKSLESKMKSGKSLTNPVPIYAIDYDEDGYPVGQHFIGQAANSGEYDILANHKFRYTNIEYVPEIKNLIDGYDPKLNGGFTKNPNIVGKPIFLVGADADKSGYMRYDNLGGIDPGARPQMIEKATGRMGNAQNGLYTVNQLWNINLLYEKGDPVTGKKIPNPFGISGALSNLIRKPILAADSAIDFLSTALGKKDVGLTTRDKDALSSINNSALSDSDKAEQNRMYMENRYFEEVYRPIIAKLKEQGILGPEDGIEEWKAMLQSESYDIVDNLIQERSKFVGKEGLDNKEYRPKDFDKDVKELKERLPSGVRGKTDLEHAVTQKFKGLRAILDSPYRDVVKILEFNLHMRYARTAQENNRLLKDTIEKSEKILNLTKPSVAPIDVEARLRSAVTRFTTQMDNATKVLYKTDTAQRRGFLYNDRDYPGNGPTGYKAPNPFKILKKGKEAEVMIYGMKKEDRGPIRDPREILLGPQFGFTEEEVNKMYPQLMEEE